MLPPTPNAIIGLTFSPDGDYLYYVSSTMSASGYFAPELLLGILYQVPFLGGTPRQVISGVDSPSASHPRRGTLSSASVVAPAYNLFGSRKR